MMKRSLGMIAMLALSAGLLSAQTPGAAPAPKRVSAKWAGGNVEANSASIKSSQGKTLLIFTGGVHATQPGVELQHADKAVAEVDPKTRQWETLKASGNVRFTVQRVNPNGQIDKASGRCAQTTIYNWKGKKPEGEKGVLAADLNGNVRLEWTQNDKEAKTAGEPMTLEGEHAQVWLTPEGVEASVTGE